MTDEQIAGYAMGHAGPSPVSLDELRDLKGAVGFDDADAAALRGLWSAIEADLDSLFDRWIARIGHFFVPTFASENGEVDESYMAAAHPRFLKWVEDTCIRPWDQAWLDYQHEIGLRHHRSKKNKTDDASAVEIVPYRYLPITIAPMSLVLRDVLAERDVEDTEPMLDAWLKALLLQIALWSRAYVEDRDW